MEINPTASGFQAPLSTAVAGLQDAQRKVGEAAGQIASGNLDPAVVLDVSSAETNFAANAKVLQAADENTKRLLDVLA